MMDDRSDSEASDREWEPHLGEGHPLGRRDTDPEYVVEREAERAPDPTDTPGDIEPPDGDEPSLTRRRLLVGGGVLGLAALAGGAGWWAQQDDAGAAVVAESYVHALASNDWSAIEALFHEDAAVTESIRNGEVEDYEAYLADHGRLDWLSAVSPTVDGVQTLQHVPEVTEDAVEDLFLRGDPDPDVVEEYRAIIVFAPVETDVLLDVDGPFEDRLTHLGDEVPLLVDLVVVSDGDGWTLWDEIVNPPV